MRQAGIIAAGALFALENHIDRLPEDHAKAQKLAEAIRKTPGVELASDNVDTNIVIFNVSTDTGTAADLIERFKQRDVLMLAISPQSIRAVTHLDVSMDQVIRACNVIRETAAQRVAS